MTDLIGSELAICIIILYNIIMKGTTVQTLGARAVAGAWCMMAGCLGHNYYYAMGVIIIINTRAHR